MSIEVPADETALPEALEQFYAQLTDLVGVRDGQPILLNNTITTFDIQSDAPFYTEGVFRNFADRKFRVSPDDLGSSARTDRFSYEYERVVEIAATEVDSNLKPEVSQKIENYKSEIARLLHEIVRFEVDTENQWAKIASGRGLKPDEEFYDLHRINFLETILYADQKRIFTDQIEDYRRSIEALRKGGYSPSQQKLLRAVAELADTYKVARPWTRQFERNFPNATVLTFADPRVRVSSLCDVSPSLYPSADLIAFQERGGSRRSITVSEETKHTELHKRTWKARAGGSFRAFGIPFGGSGRGRGSSSYRKDFSKLASFELDFAGLDEVYADRGLWFDPTLFGDAELKPIFDSIPGARDLEYAAVSLIIARGLKLTLNFSEKLEVERWKKQSWNVGGGVSVFGFRFGGRASGSSYDYDYKLSDDQKSVTFEDADDHCRLLAVRLEEIYHPPGEGHVAGFSHDEIQSIKAGKTLVTGVQAKRLKGL